MAELPQRFDHVRRSARLARLFAFAAVAALVIVGVYVFLPWGETPFERFLLGLGIIAAALLGGALAVLAWGLVDLLLKIEAHGYRIYDALRDIDMRIERQETDLKAVAESAQLSDFARAISHRARERTALRLAINEEIVRGDWEAAYALVEQLESRHGYKNEAARLREEVDRSRDRDRLDKVHEAVEQVRTYMNANDWDRARRDMDSLLNRWPDNPEIQALPDEFARRRNDHKRRLLKAWDESVQRNEVDRGIAILKELDQYLTPREAAALEESARGVFRAKLHNLGVQFSLAVSESRWNEALSTGEQIIAEFPNSRMAQEVRERIHVLRKRVAEAEGTPEPVGAAESQH